MPNAEKIEKAVTRIRKSFDRLMAAWLIKESDTLEEEGFTPQEMFQIMKQATRGKAS